MSNRNDITGDKIQTKASSVAYRDGWDRIFGNKKPSIEERWYNEVTADLQIGVIIDHDEYSAKAASELSGDDLEEAIKGISRAFLEN